MIKDFSDAQKAAFQIFDRELSVSAGAGSGKTSVLVERFVRAVTEKNIRPSRILAITFTDKAANEMKTRLVRACRERGLHAFRRDIENGTISTIHSFCARVLKENPIEAGIDPFFRTLNEGEKDILAEKTLDALFDQEKGNARWMAILAETGEDAARESIRKLYDVYRATGGDEKLFVLSGTIAQIGRKREFTRVARRFEAMIESEKRRLACYDFDDLLFLAYRLLSGSSPAARAVCERYRELFELILVDEYQDVSPLQDRLIGLLRSERNLFIVGDTQQSIYGFRHAEPAVFRRHVETHRQKNAVSRNLVLSENYRSRPEILAFVNGLFRPIFPQEEFVELRPRARFASSGAGAIELLCLPCDKAEDEADSDQMRVREARRLTARIEELTASGRAAHGDIAILFRATGALRIYEKALADRNIPYHVVKGKGFFEKPEIADLVGFLKTLEDPEDDIALAGVLRSPLGMVSDDALYWIARCAKEKSGRQPLARGFEQFEKIETLAPEDRAKLGSFKALVDALRQAKEQLRLSGVLEQALRRTDYEAKLLAGPAGRQRVANVRKLVQMARGFEANGVVGLGDFVHYIGRLAERERMEPEARLESPIRDAVTLSTVHSAKGLEFPVVIVADMGYQPKAKSRGPFAAMPGIGIGQRTKGPDGEKPEDDDAYQRILGAMAEREEAEGWRLLYVAMTRAKEHLLLSGFVSLGKKTGEFNPKASWMGSVCAALGYHPARPNGAAIDFHGVKIGLVPPEAPAIAVKKASRPVSEAIAWPADLDKTLPERLQTRFKSYDQTQDRTVSDLLAAAGQKEVAAHPAEEGQDEPAIPANEFGTLFHRFMEHLAKKRSVKISPKEWALPLFSRLTPAEKARMKKEVLLFWNGPWGRQLRAAKKCYPELPFIYKTKGGLLKGQIDLVFQTSGGDWVILDYKTHTMAGGRSPEAVAGDYRFQLELYALVFYKLYGVKPARGVLYFSSAGRGMETAYQTGDFGRFERELEHSFKKLDF